MTQHFAVYVALVGCAGCSLANTVPPPDDVQWRTDLAGSGGTPSDAGSGKDGSSDLARPGPPSTLVVNEVYPHGSDVMTDPDFVELFNGGSGQVNLRGYKVRDHNATWYALPDDAMIPAGGFYIINCDGLMSGALPGAHVPFKLGGSGDEVHFAGPDGIELDSTTWGTGIIDVPKNQSLGRVPDQTGPFVVLTKPSRGKSNQ